MDFKEYKDIKKKYGINDTQYLMYKYIKSKTDSNHFRISNKELMEVFGLAYCRINKLTQILKHKKLIYILYPSTNNRLIFSTKQQLEDYIKNC